MIKRVLIILSTFLFSCEETVDWDLTTESIQLMVVDGKFTNERTRHLVKLTQTAQTDISRFSPVTNALVAITDGEKVNILTENSFEPGNYYSEPGVQGVFGKPYFLYIRYNGQEFTARSYMVPVQPLDTLLYRPKDNDANLFEITLVDTPDASIIEYYIDWSHLIDCENEMDCQAQLVHYTISSIDVNEMFKPGKERVYFPKGSRVIRKKYSLNTEQQQFYRSLMMETEWRGGMFDVKTGNVKTNLSEGAIGYFLVSTVVTDTTYIE